MRSSVIFPAVVALVLLLSGCPQIAGNAVSANLHGTASAAAHGRQGAHGVDEIAWFQGTIDEAFSHQGCVERRHTRRTLFRL